MKGYKRYVITAILLIISCIFCFGCTPRNLNYKGGDFPNSQTLSENVNIKESTQNDKLSLMDAVERVQRSVVAISVGSSWGSGVIVDIDDGVNKNNVYYVITCHHVISSGGNVTVFVPDENSYDFDNENYNEDYAFTGIIDGVKRPSDRVQLVGGDKDSDIAVLKLTVPNGTRIVEAKIPPSEYKIKRGEDVFSIGNPTGSLPGTVSKGIVSYPFRYTSVSTVGDMVLTQIDVQINHGNSGGALFNLYGELIGITNSGTGEVNGTYYEGLNFAIPFYIPSEYGANNGFKNIAEQLIATNTDENFGYVTGRWQLGVSIVEDSSRFYGTTYVFVYSLVDNGDFKIAGMQVNDIINSITYGGKTTVIKTENAFINCVNAMKQSLGIGDKYKVAVTRNVGLSKTDIEVEVTIYQYIFFNTGYSEPID